MIIRDEVAVSQIFLQAFFEIEKHYADKSEKFRFRSFKGQQVGRLKNHITKADLQLFTTVQKYCNPFGKLREGYSKHELYIQLKNLYCDNACSKDQFYAAFNKFVLHNLISVEIDSFTNEELYTLNQYVDSQTGKVGYLSLLHPVVFTEAFNEMPICQQKLFYQAVTQQGGKERSIQRNLNDGLFEFLHRKQVNQVRAILDNLVAKPIYGTKPLFAAAEIKKNVVGGYKAVYRVHSDFIIPYVSGQGDEYHAELPFKKRYRRIARFMREVMAELGIGEFELFKEGRSFYQLFRLVKDKGFSYIRTVLTRIRDIHKTHFVYPDNVLDFLKDEIHNKSMTILLAIAQETGVYKFIAPYGTDRQERFNAFGSSMKGIDKGTFRRLCKLAAPKLLKEYGVSPVAGVTSYVKVPKLDNSLDMPRVRLKALHFEKCPEKYHDLEYKAEFKLRKNEHPSAITKWLLKEVEKLPTWELFVDPPRDFRLEEYLTNTILIHSAS
ncbi:hypothetical protein SAMN04487897_1314 [Paenibacillus sp. yr247]|uniref:hypothetical protein n=1 Tax=Paenibacillus sp. yr247 TaxID=1761880 RepID=UPI00088D6F66|nr:hypothetical protein [Paenibacillus sp. yr247]SDP01733.1 hypothetical protein SAMN04487897_1314 [Paenibacillus sp. yr247]